MPYIQPTLTKLGNGQNIYATAGSGGGGGATQVIVAVNGYASLLAPVSTSYNAGSVATIPLPAPFPPSGDSFWVPGATYRITWTGEQYNSSATPNTEIFYIVKIKKGSDFSYAYYLNSPQVYKVPATISADNQANSWSIVVTAPPFGSLTQGFGGLDITVGTNDPTNGGTSITRHLTVEKLATS
jgi:hypothetical protein